MDFFQKQFAKFLTTLLILLILIVFKQTQLFAQDAVPDCTKDPNSLDYCGESAPFRGCNSPPAEWICQCRLPSGKWWSECSVMEDTAGKQKYKDKCGGDEQKAFTQWKYDIALAETGGQCSCGGQNICGSLIPTPKVVVVTLEPQVIIPTTSPAQISTTTSSNQPTPESAFPTSRMLPLPYDTPSGPTPELFPRQNAGGVNLPNIQMPNLKLPGFPKLCFNSQISLASTNLLIEKPMGILRSFFISVSQLDKYLEDAINQKLYSTNILKH